jgi:phospholipid/cholesterol/gamma-HCH transport system substrate-binding protein
MEVQDINRGIKVGAFVIGGIIIFMTALIYMGRDGNIFNKTFTISAIFKNVEGLKEGDNVWLSGVKIGTVKKVEIVADGKVIVSLSLKDNQNEFIKTNATAYVGSDGFVGNKIVVIRPGNKNEVIQDMDTINALSPTDTQELFNIAKEIGSNTKSITDDLKLISFNIKSGKGVLGELMNEGPISKDLRSSLSSIKEASKNSNQATESLNKILNTINTGDGVITKLLSDTSYSRILDQTAANLVVVGLNAKKASNELLETAEKLNSEKNALAVVSTDTLFAAQLKSVMENTKDATEKLDMNMNALQHNFLFRGYFKKQERLKRKQK